MVALFGLTKFDQLRVVADKLLGAIRQNRLDCGEAQLDLTYSIGAVMAAPQADLDAIVQRADEALYRAKADGRDRAVLDCLMLDQPACGQQQCCNEDNPCPAAVKQAGF